MSRLGESEGTFLSRLIGPLKEWQIVKQRENNLFIAKRGCSEFCVRQRKLITSVFVV